MRVAGVTLMVSAAATLSAIGLWAATGQEGYTRWPNARLEQADAPPAKGESDLLKEAGFSESSVKESRADIQSRFAFGLVPGGVDPAHLVSVATVGAVAGFASGMAVFAHWRAKRTVRNVISKGAQS